MSSAASESLLSSDSSAPIEIDINEDRKEEEDVDQYFTTDNNDVEGSEPSLRDSNAVQFRRRRKPSREYSGRFGQIPFREWIWRLLSVRASKFGHHTRYLPSEIFEIVSILLIIATCVSVVLFSDSSLSKNSGFVAFYVILQVVGLIFFSCEYFFRLWSCVEDARLAHLSSARARLRWFRKPLSLLDLFCLIPFYIDIVSFMAGQAGSSSILKALQLVRVMTFLRIERQSKSFQRLGFVIKKKGTELTVAAFLLMVLILMSSVLIHFAEKEAQPEFQSVLGSMWWSIITLSTVGYGDAVPHTPAGKFVGGVTAIFGIVLFALPAGILGSGFVEILYEEREARKMAEMQREETERSRQRSRDLLSVSDFSLLSAENRGKERDEEENLYLPPHQSSSTAAALTPANAIRVACPCCSHEFPISLIPLSVKE